MWKCAVSILAVLLLAAVVSAQVVPPLTTPAAEAQRPTPQDTLGRTTPRGAVVNFLRAAQRGDLDNAARYLETRLNGTAAAELAQQLFVVLDRGLPTRLNQLSDRPEGSVANPLRPDRESLGTITSGDKTLEVSLRRVDMREAGSYWLFSADTLRSVPAVYRELSVATTESALPQFLVTSSFLGISLYQWLAVLVVLPGTYFLLTLAGRVIRRVHGNIRRRLSRNPGLPDVDALPVPVRLFILALIIRWALSRVGLSLLARQFWSNLAASLVTVGIVWLLLLLDAWGERYLHRYLWDRGRMSALSVLRPARRVLDILVILAGTTATLYEFGVDPTTALAGFGVGSIAVALAARKTLENILAGVSLISDDAIRVGDFLKVGETLGTVENIGLRYTQIRTRDRSLVSIANAQMGSMTLENLSAREKFWFHPILGLRYETSPEQLRAVLDGIRAFLTQDARVETDTVGVRLLRFAPSSLDVEIFAYVPAPNWDQFLGIQEHLLFRVLEIVQKAGVQIATPSHITYVVTDSGGEGMTSRPGVTHITARARPQG